MKAKRIWSALFGLLSVLLIAGTIALSFLSLNAPVRLIAASEDARLLTEDFMDSVCRGDLSSAGSMLLGQPRLNTETVSQSALGDLLWEAYCDSLSYEFNGDLYASDSGYSRDVTVTMLDIPAAMNLLKARTQTLLADHAEAAEGDMVFDENGSYREDVAMEVLLNGMSAILAEEASFVSRSITLTLCYQDGSWWIVPEQALIAILCGGMGK